MFFKSVNGKSSFDWQAAFVVALITAFVTVFVSELWRSYRHQVDYKLSYEMKVLPYKLEKTYFLWKKPYPATSVQITITNFGRKVQKNVGLYIRFKKPIIFTYVPKGLPIYDSEGNSIVGNEEAFRKETVAGIVMPTFPSSFKIILTFILDCKYEKGIEKNVVELMKLSSETQ